MASAAPTVRSSLSAFEREPSGKLDGCFTRVNGQPATQVTALDRGLLYGDGVFRTLRVRSGKPLWWHEHWQKLQADAARLGITCPAAEIWLDDCATLPHSDGILRLTLTSGTGARGYVRPNEPVPTRMLQFYEDAVKEINTAGALLHLCRLRLSAQPALAGIKHLNRLENVLARAEWSDPDVAEGLLRDGHGRLIGGVSSNIFVLRGDQLLTPQLNCCGVAGVTRARLIARAPRLGYVVAVGEIRLADLDDAEALFYCNSVQGLRWVSRLGRRCWSQSTAFEPLARLIQEDLWAD